MVHVLNKVSGVGGLPKGVNFKLKPEGGIGVSQVMGEGKRNAGQCEQNRESRERGVEKSIAGKEQFIFNNHIVFSRL